MDLPGRTLAALSPHMPQWWNSSPHHFTEPDFVYSHLPDNHIRILTVEPGPRWAPVRCSFQTLALAGGATIDFTALSYSWGPRQEPKSILVDDGQLRVFQLRVQPSAYDLLLAVRSDTERRNVWLDSVCINQTCAADKTEQVMLMDQIYTAATRVLIWLGPGTSNSDYVMDSIHDQRVESFDTVRFARGMLEILDRQWFQRTWIIQEFVLNRNPPDISCGFAPPVSWDSFMDAYNTSFPSPQGADGVVPGHTPASIRAQDLEQWRVYQRTLTMLNSLRRGIQKHAPSPAHYDLVYLLYATRSFLATDPRDKIYGLLGMAHRDTRSHPLIRADYNKSVEQVFRDATVYLLCEAMAVRDAPETEDPSDETPSPPRPQTEEAQTTAFYSVIALNQLRTDGGMVDPGPNRPSWVPNFSPSPGGYPSVPWLYGGELKDIPLHRRDAVRLCLGGRGITVKGLILDRVKDIVAAPSHSGQSLPPHTYPQIAFLALFSLPFYILTLGRALPPWRAPEITRTRTMLIAEAEALLNVVTTAEKKAQQSYEPLWKTLLLSLSVNDEFRDEQQGQAMWSQALYMARDFTATQRPDAWWIARPRLVAFMNHVAANPVVKNIRLAFSAGRSFFVGEGGLYYGIGQGELRPGDLVALLFPDANRPFILREAGNNYEMVGCAYLPEPMRTHAAEAKAGEFEDITLV